MTVPFVFCGTRSGYQRHRRSGEPACDECKRASALYKRNRREETTPPQWIPGTCP